MCPDIYHFGLSASSSILRAYSSWFHVLCSSWLLKLHGSGKSENNRTRPSGHVTEKARGTQIKTAVGLALYQLSYLPLSVPPNHLSGPGGGGSPFSPTGRSKPERQSMH